MVELEIDGRKVEVAEGSMVMDAANKLGTYIPHFCYHKKLSIAANCRMCLVQVEKAPKPLPACATPVTQGMKVYTASEQAKKAQAGVMEFLLINHPLDCPICDQGGECQLQDLAVGYGPGASRYSEAKRVVFHKNVGPLISMEEMSRCIHCTRCVRFGQEIAGVMELGMLGRGEHSEITSFVGRSVDSELSGNMIDICPVGALTSKPFRYSARTWELARRRSVSPHDSLGANLIVQVKANRVMRVVPFENEAVNECWISDKDRFSYEALNSPERLTAPMIKQDGRWQEVDWSTALEFVAHALKDIRASHGGAAIGTLVSPHATFEEAYLAQKLTRALGSENVDHRLRRSDFPAPGSAVPWLGMPIAELSSLDRVLVVGSFLRKDHPLIAQRLRQAAKKRAQIHLVNPADDEPLVALASRIITRPSRLGAVLDEILAALDGAAAGEVAQRVAASLAAGSNIGLFLGNAAAQALDACALHAKVQAIAARLAAGGSGARARVGFLGEAANSVGAGIAGAVPGAGGLDARRMIADARRAYLVVHAEPALDHADGAAARAALAAADLTVVLSAFRQSEDVADVLLPIAPFTETAGSFINCEGRSQSFAAVVRPLGETRPGWKVLRVLGNLVGASGFEQDSAEAVRDEAMPGDLAQRLDNRAPSAPAAAGAGADSGAGFERVADIPIHFADALARRAPALQQTADARAPRARMNPADLARLGVPAGGKVRIGAGAAAFAIDAEADAGVPDGCVRLAGAHPATLAAGPLAGRLAVERA
ncbi:MAG: NADH-quinone oxidoreductase subunit G [Burkholderiales bacterium]|nr:NADH-quinone oxidoreductase subunit G [Burkholderiales bacterium]